MATIIIDPNGSAGTDQFPIGGNNTIFFQGAGSNETATIGGGSQLIVGAFNAGGDTIKFTGNASQYTVRSNGGSIIIQGPNGTVATIPAPQPGLSFAQQPNILFADASFKLASTVSGSGATFTLTNTAAGGSTTTITPTDQPVPGNSTPPAPAFTVNVAATDVTEGAGSIVYTFTLSSAQSSAVTLNVATVGGTASVSTDYTPVSTTVTFAPGQTTTFLTVNVIDDAINEPAETVIIQVSGATLAANADLTAVIIDNDAAPAPPPPPVPQQFILTTGNDTFTGSAANDRITGAQNVNEPGKLLSQNDIIDGGAGTDTIELTNAPGAVVANQLVDGDFTNVLNVETLRTNYTQIQLGREADEAGLTTIDTSGSDTQNVGGGTLLDLSLDGNGDGLPDFNNVLNVTMGGSTADNVRLNLATSGGSTINTGVSFTTVGGGVAVAQDTITVVGQVNPVRITFTSANVGNGSAFDADGTTLGLTAQSEDAADGLTGPVTRFDDEGIRFTGANFDVRDISGAARGTFGDVVLGTNQNDNFNAVAGGSYINAGAGNDTLNGGAGIDFLVGSTGNDVLNGAGGADTLLGGAGNDTLNGGAGIDVMDGAAGSDTYVFANGEFIAAEAITDTGTGAGELDYINITSASPITDAFFAGKLGFEGLITNVTNGAGAEVTLAANAQASGITVIGRAYSLNFTTGGATFLAPFVSADTTFSDDDIDASAYTVGLTVNGSFGAATITTGSGNDVVNVYPTSPQTGAIVLGAGDDVLNGGYALNGGTVLTGGTGTDTLTLGGSGLLQNFGQVVAINAAIGAGVTGFERFTLLSGDAAAVNPDASLNDRAGNAVVYTLTVTDANIASGASLTIDGSALRAGIATNLGADNKIGGVADTLTNEVLTVNAQSLSANRAVIVTGGAADDFLNGGGGDDTLSGGAGNDTITGDAGVDTINGGDGNDIITGGASQDILNGGAGNDTFVFNNGEFIFQDNVVGGDGTDAFQVLSNTAIVDAAFANKSSVETLNSIVVNGAGAEVTLAALAQASGVVTVNSSDDDINAAGYTVGLTVNAGTQVLNGVTSFFAAGNITTGSGNDTVNLTGPNGFPAAGAIVLGAGDDTLNAGSLLSNVFNNAAQTAALTGGAGTDVVTIGGAQRPQFNSAGLVFNDTYSFDLNANFTGFEQITVLGADQATAVTGAANDRAGNAASATVFLSDLNIAAGTTFIVDASSLVATATGLGADLEIGGTGANADVFTTPTLTLNAAGVTRNLDVRGGAGNDQIFTGAGADTINGGAGNDVITAGAGADTINGGDGNDVISGGAGFDTINGGAGNDVINLTVPEFNSDNDNVNGGDGNDILQITGTLAVQEIADVGFNGRFASIEQVTLVGAPGGTAFTYTAGFFSETAGVRIINLGANTSGSTVSVANYSVAGATLNDIAVATNNATFVGSNFADTFNLGVTNTTTGGGNDAVRGGAGDDIINFGSTLTGADIVNGEAGNDTLNVSGNGTTQVVGVNVTATFAGGVQTSGIFATEFIILASGVAGTAGTAIATPGTAGTATSYNVFVDDTSFETAGSSLTVNGSGLRVVSTGVGADGFFGSADDVTTAEVLNYNGAAVTSLRIQNVSGGAANDTITGGAGVDTLTGNGGNDVISGGGGNDAIDGGVGNDTLNGDAGNDTITGGEGGDFIVGGLGFDTINLAEATAVRDTVVFNNNDAARTAPDVVNGFAIDTVRETPGPQVLAATTDVIDFGSAIIATTSASVANGVVIQGSVLQNAINSSTSLLAAIQLVEQEFQSGADPLANNGVIAFTYQGNTYIGEVNGAQGLEAFGDLVQLTGVSGVTQLIDADGLGAGTALGLSI